MKKLFIFTLISDCIFIFIFLIFYFSQNITESIYSNTIFPFISLILNLFNDIFYFSLTEILIIIFILLFISLPVITIIYCKKNKNGFIKIISNIIKIYFSFFSFLIIWFYLVWGFNYFRKPLYVKNTGKEIMNNKFNNYLKIIINKSNKLYTKNPYSLNELNLIINNEINKFEKFKKIKTAKKIKFFKTKILEKTNTLGFISPFLLESHISCELLDGEKPSVITHEKSHLYGIADETEANYSAFIICIKSDNKYLQYSGYFDVLYYFLIEYKKRNSAEDYKKIYDTIRPEIKEEFKKQKERFLKNKNVISKLSAKFYNIYLKINKIKDGNQSYSKVVDMIINNNIPDENQ